LRVILDSRLRLPLESRLVRSVADAGGSKNDVLVFCSTADQRKKTDLEARGIRVEEVQPDAEGHPDLHAVMRRLGELEITSVMIEGGSTVNGTALAFGLVDKVFLYYAPKIMADAESIPFASGTRSSHIEEIHVKQLRLHPFAEDFAVEGYLRDPYGG
jgi:diaminohydroxyphosphoribosylaminopyrimidine deaminase/5-amino-6-(5-phosphoribosylamino)uracil reductase